MPPSGGVFYNGVSVCNLKNKNARTLSEAAIRAEKLVMRYGDLTAVDGVSFTVARGEVFGFLGPNGAGKTTTISMLTTLTRPTSGEAWISDHSVTKAPNAVRREIGIVFQDSTLDTKLTVEENLDFHARIYGLTNRAKRRRRIAKMLKLSELTERRKTLAAKLSGGMRRRLEIVRALLHRPNVLFLDEPTLGLDVQNRRRIWEYLINTAANDGTTIFVTTHQLEEAEQFHRVGIIDQGKLVACDTPATLRASLGGSLLKLRCAEPEETARRIMSSTGLLPIVKVDTVSLVVDSPGEFLAEELGKLGGLVKQVEVVEPKLEEVFLSLTGHGLRDAEVTGGGAWREVHQAQAKKVGR